MMSVDFTNSRSPLTVNIRSLVGRYGTSQKKVSVQRAFFQLRTGIVRICERAFLDYATGTRTGMYVVNMDRANVSKLATEDVLTACAFFLR